jgi:hypothetical protein
MSDEKQPLKPNSLCSKCRSNLIHGAKYRQADPWMALEVTALLTLVNVTLKSNKFHIQYGGDLYQIERIKCLSCYQPEAFQRIIEVAKETRDLTKVKAIGEE